MHGVPRLVGRGERGNKKAKKQEQRKTTEMHGVPRLVGRGDPGAERTGWAPRSGQRVVRRPDARSTTPGGSRGATQQKNKKVRAKKNSRNARSTTPARSRGPRGRATSLSKKSSVHGVPRLVGRGEQSTKKAKKQEQRKTAKMHGVPRLLGRGDPGGTQPHTRTTRTKKRDRKPCGSDDDF